MKAINDVAMTDLDGDSTVELLTGNEDASVHCLDSAGTIRGQFHTGGPVNVLRLADLDGDGHTDALAGAWDGKVYALAYRAQ